jgi:Tol biopolymer transport system component
MQRMKWVAFCVSTLGVHAVLASQQGTVRSSEGARLVWADVDQTEYLVVAPSPDGAFLTYTDGGTGNLMIRDLTAGTSRRLTYKERWDPGGGVAASSLVSPDGRLVAYAWDNNSGDFRGYDLRIIPASGEVREPRILYRGEGLRYVEPTAWWPDGKSLLITQHSLDGTYQIATVRVDDGAVQTVKSLGRRDPRKVSLSPDGQYVAYDAPRSGDIRTRDIFVVQVADGTETTIVNDASDDQQPTWSPDAKRILFISDRSGHSSLWSVPVQNGAVSGPAALVRPEIGRLLGMTNSGSVFHVSGGPTRKVYIADVDSSLTVRKTNAVLTAQALGAPSAPVWSPDGRFLAYLLVRPSIPGVEFLSILIRSIRTGEEREVPFGRSPANRRMQWFPDGRSLLVGSMDPQANQTGYYRVDIGTGAAELLFHGGLQNPSLSADGKAIYYIGNTGGSQSTQVFRFDVSSRTETRLTLADRGVTAVAISSDGATLAYNASDSATNSTTVCVVPVAGGVVRRLFSHDGVGPQRNQLAWTPDQRHLLFVVDPDGTPSGTGEVVDLWKVPIAGGPAQPAGLSIRGRLRFPALDPSGRRLVFEAVETHPYELWAFQYLVPRSTR